MRTLGVFHPCVPGVSNRFADSPDPGQRARSWTNGDHFRFGGGGIRICPLAMRKEDNK